MANKYEYYDTGDSAHDFVWGDRWSAQSFTPQAAHKITSVKLKVFRFGAARTFYVDVYLANGNHKPTGESLCSGSRDSGDFGDSSPGA